MNPKPLLRQQALARMLALVGKPIPYVLGTGDAEGATTRDGLTGFDCFGAAVCYAYGITRHEPGANRGPWATVSDDWNCNSAIEDSEHKQERFVPVAVGDEQPGDLIMYPTIRLPGHPIPFIGHVQLVLEVPVGWQRSSGYALLKVAHCHGPDGRTPGVTISDGSACDRHDEQWHLPQHVTRLLRIVER